MESHEAIEAKQRKVQYYCEGVFYICADKSSSQHRAGPGIFDLGYHPCLGAVFVRTIPKVTRFSSSPRIDSNQGRPDGLGGAETETLTLVVAIAFAVSVQCSSTLQPLMRRLLHGPRHRAAQQFSDPHWLPCCDCLCNVEPPGTTPTSFV